MVVCSLRARSAGRAKPAGPVGGACYLRGMRYTVFGAGSIGTVLAAALAEAGIDVRIAGRGAVPDLEAEGHDETLRATVPVVAEPDAGDVVLLCVHEPDVVECCPRWRGATVVTFQNGVASEETAATWCDVIGGVWRMTCFLVAPGKARFTRRGRIVVGRYPEGVDDQVSALAADLGRAGFDVGVSPDIMADKWLKLCLNVASTINALVPRAEHVRPEFGAVKAALLTEARDVLRAAGIEPHSAAGGDLSIDEEIAKVRRAGVPGRVVFNQTWRTLSRGRRPPERYHDIVVDIAEKSGLEAPCNAALLRFLDAATEPECVRLDEIVSALPGTGRDTPGTT